MIHPRIILASADAVATHRGVSLEAIYDQVDGGFGDESFLWVFNIASDLNAKRELRFWSREINAPESTRSLDLEDVIKAIVPRRDALPGQFCGMRNWEVGDLLRVSRPMLLDLRVELEAVPHNGGIYVPRAALEKFFRRRWCYHNHNQPLQTKLI
jgi:hypothetical protein